MRDDTALAEKRKMAMSDEEIIEVALTSGKVFKVYRGSYLEHENRSIVGSASIVSFREHGSGNIVMTHAHFIMYVTYLTSVSYEE